MLVGRKLARMTMDPRATRPPNAPARTLGNPLLDLVKPIGWNVGRPTARLGIDTVEGRWRYSWAVPTDDALDAIAAIGPIVEVGAGTGYWARLLKDQAVDVVAYDVAPPGGPIHNRWHCEVPVRTWTEVLRGDAWRAGSHSDRALLLCWPPLGTAMAENALTAYRGSQVVYVGEGPWTGYWGDEPVTGTTAFLDLLTAQYAAVGDPVLLPSFGGEFASLTVWRRAR